MVATAKRVNKVARIGGGGGVGNSGNARIEKFFSYYVVPYTHITITSAPFFSLILET